MPFARGNRLGRGRPPAGRAFSDMLRVALAEKGDDGRPKLRRLADVFVDMALAGDIQAIKEIADRLEGRPQPRLVDGGAPVPRIIINFSPEDRGLL